MVLSLFEFLLTEPSPYVMKLRLFVSLNVANMIMDQYDQLLAEIVVVVVGGCDVDVGPNLIIVVDGVDEKAWSS